MSSDIRTDEMDFVFDRNNLYREESFTDLKVGSIRRLTPVRADGTDDGSRSPLFIGSTQLMSPEGPIPIQSRLMANNLEEAMRVFPAAMKEALQELIRNLEQMDREQQGRPQDDSRIIIPR